MKNWIALAATIVIGQISPAQAQSCVGDCDLNAEVTVDEVILAINVALGDKPISTCASGDSNSDDAIDVSEIMQSVSNLLEGCPARSDPLVVGTTQGLVRGSAVNGIRSFLGIPYSAPPIGERRWREPQDHTGWTGIRETTLAGAICPQDLPIVSLSAGEEGLPLSQCAHSRPSSRRKVAGDGLDSRRGIHSWRWTSIWTHRWLYSRRPRQCHRRQFQLSTWPTRLSRTPHPGSRWGSLRKFWNSRSKSKPWSGFRIISQTSVATRTTSQSSVNLLEAGACASY